MGFTALGLGLQGLWFGVQGFSVSDFISQDEGFKTIVLPYVRYIVGVSYTPILTHSND